MLVAPRDARKIRAFEEYRVLETNENLPQLYRFCFLMTGDAAKAQEAFQGTLREAALRAAQGEAPTDRFWFFRDARWRCVALAEAGLQAEPGALEEAEIAPSAQAQIEQLHPEQLAVWISAAPEPQRSALATYYLDEFTPRETLQLLELKASEFSSLVVAGRRQFQAWLNAVSPHYEDE
ncbi:MAG: RNA polymerase sigma factor [Chthoniobacterales bacterium]